MQSIFEIRNNLIFRNVCFHLQNPIQSKNQIQLNKEKFKFKLSNRKITNFEPKQENLQKKFFTKEKKDNHITLIRDFLDTVGFDLKELPP